MKKLIAALTLLLAFTINANAQDKKVSNSHDLAKQEATELSACVKLNQAQTDAFVQLFELKHKTLEDKSLSAERKVALSHTIEAKIRATLDVQQTERLEKNQELLRKLIN